MSTPTPAAPQYAAESSLIYGASRTYKSTELAEVALWIYEKTGHRTRLISTEISSQPIFRPYIEAGIVEAFWLQRSHHPRSALRKLIRGEWPVVQSTANGPALGWRKWDAKLDQVGGYIFEGLTTFSELIMMDLVATGRKINEDVVGMYDEEGEKLGASGRSHYMAVQGDIMFMLKEAPKALFHASGGTVKQIFWSAHQNKGQDEQKQTVYGPATVGKALTGAIQKEVGLLLHFEEVAETMNKVIGGKQTTVQEKKVRAYFQSHPDPENPAVLWQAGPRIPPVGTAIRKLMDRWPHGYFELTLSPRQGVVDFLRFLDQLQAGATNDLRAQIAKIQQDRAASAQSQTKPGTTTPTSTQIVHK
jgi:hypothetical protein